jgi:hypothetical protein
MSITYKLPSSLIEDDLYKGYTYHLREAIVPQYQYHFGHLGLLEDSSEHFDMMVINLLLSQMHTIQTLKECVTLALLTKEIDKRLEETIDKVLYNASLALILDQEIMINSLKSTLEVKLLLWILISYSGLSNWNKLTGFIFKKIESAHLGAISLIRGRAHYYDEDKQNKVRNILEYFQTMLRQIIYFSMIGGPLSEGEKDSLDRDIVLQRKHGYTAFTTEKTGQMLGSPRQLLKKIEIALTTFGKAIACYNRRISSTSLGDATSPFHGSPSESFDSIRDIGVAMGRGRKGKVREDRSETCSTHTSICLPHFPSRANSARTRTPGGGAENVDRKGKKKDTTREAARDNYSMHTTMRAPPLLSSLADSRAHMQNLLELISCTKTPLKKRDSEGMPN